MYKVISMFREEAATKIQANEYYVKILVSHQKFHLYPVKQGLVLR